MSVLFALLVAAAVEMAHLSEAATIDPITTGGTVTEQMKRDWEERRATYERCEACLAEQAFPEGDLPED